MFVLNIHKNVHINAHFKSIYGALQFRRVVTGFIAHGVLLVLFTIGLGYAYKFKGVGNKPVTSNLD